MIPQDPATQTRRSQDSSNSQDEEVHPKFPKKHRKSREKQSLPFLMLLVGLIFLSVNLLPALFHDNENDDSEFHEIGKVFEHPEVTLHNIEVGFQHDIQQLLRPDTGENKDTGEEPSIAELEEQLQVLQKKLDEKHQPKSAPTTPTQQLTPTPSPSPIVKHYEQSKMGGPHSPSPYFVSQILEKNKLPSKQKHRMNAVKKAIKHAWDGYKTVGWGADEIRPLSDEAENGFNLGLTIVDSLDTLWIAGMNDEFKEARDWVAQNLDISATKLTISVFETFIRIVGGLLSAYELSADTVFLTKAQEVADMLLNAFNSPTGIPFSLMDVQSRVSYNPEWTGDASILAEAGSVQLELRALSRFTGDDKYAMAGDRAFFALRECPHIQHGGLYPLYISNDNPIAQTDHVGLGAMGDSFYEYMLKLYLQTRESEPKFRDMYLESSAAILDHLVFKSSDGLLYLAELENGRVLKKMDHLTCFAGGMFALGAEQLHELPDKPRHKAFAAELTRTCYEGYRRMPSGIAPELWIFPNGEGMTTDGLNLHYLLRPETVESIFILYRLTGDQKYQDWGWEIFENIERNTKVERGYSGLLDVTSIEPLYNDKMESFFLAETLKYLFLLFAPPDLISLDDFVFNTEAHPLRKFDPLE